jgi:hypothetical protein
VETPELPAGTRLVWVSPSHAVAATDDVTDEAVLAVFADYEATFGHPPPSFDDEAEARP